MGARVNECVGARVVSECMCACEKERLRAPNTVSVNWCLRVTKYMHKKLCVCVHVCACVGVCLFVRVCVCVCVWMGGLVGGCVCL